MIESVPLGNTGHEVTRIGLGPAALGRPAYINLGHESDLTGRTDREGLERHAHDMLNAAYALGIRYFDTARSYGDGEGFLGRWLPTAAKGGTDLTISSKWGYRYVADWRIDADVHEVKQHDLANLEHQLQESKDRLGSHLAVYQIHSATLDSGVLDDDLVLGRLAELRDEGLTIGLSTSGPEQARTIRKAISIERGGARLFGTVQSTWNLLEPSAGPALAEAHAAGMGVIIKESVANGRLTPRAPDSVGPLLREYPRHGPDAIAIAAALAQPWIDTVLSGAATRDHLESNLAALAVGPLSGLPDLAEEPAVYWAKRSALEWT